MDTIKWEDLLQCLRAALADPGSTAVPAALLGAFSLIILSSYGIVRDVVKPYFSPLRSLKGPDGASFFFGHLKVVTEDKVPGSWEKAQHDKYGHVFVTKAWLNVRYAHLSHHKAHF